MMSHGSIEEVITIVILKKSHNDVVRCDFIVRLFKRNKIIFKFSTGGFESTSRRVVKASERNVVGHMQPTVIDQSE